MPHQDGGELSIIHQLNANEVRFLIQNPPARLNRIRNRDLGNSLV